MRMILLLNRNSSVSHHVFTDPLHGSMGDRGPFYELTSVAAGADIASIDEFLSPEAQTGSFYRIANEYEVAFATDPYEAIAYLGEIVCNPNDEVSQFFTYMVIDAETSPEIVARQWAATFEPSVRDQIEALIASDFSADQVTPG